MTIIIVEVVIVTILIEVAVVLVLVVIIGTRKNKLAVVIVKAFEEAFYEFFWNILSYLMSLFLLALWML